MHGAMCGRFTLTTTPEEIAQHFGLDEVPLLEPRFNVAPTQPVATIARERAHRVLTLRRWGLVPPWADDAKIGARMINARIESAARRSAFESAFRERRCLVPADGFYEWGARSHGVKPPHHVALPGRACFAIAGLWESWRDPAGAPLETCTLLTMPANERVRAVHDRMPVILDPSDYEAWLAPQPVAPALFARILEASPAARLELRPVGSRVNDARVDDARLLDPPAPGPVQLEL
jgi:putative SOS response-associated peptidase YedK